MSSRRKQTTRHYKPTQVSDSLQNLTSGLNTPRDKQFSSHYTVNHLQPAEFEAAYQTSWLARAIIDKRADDSTRKWREWQAEANQITAIEKVESKFHVKNKVNKALKMAGLYGGAAIYFDLGEDSSEPLNLNTVTRNKLRSVVVLTRNNLSSGEINRNPLDENFGKPDHYIVQSSNSEQVYIHHTRLAIFHGVENPAVSAEWGDSRLTPVMDALKQFEGTAANISSLVYEAKVDVFSIAGLTQLVKDSGNLDKLVSRYTTLATLKGNNGMMVIDKDNEDYSQKTITFGGLTDILDKFQQNISGAAGYPRAILFGTATGGLGSTGELELSSYYDRINSEQENEIQPALELFDEVLIRTALGARPDDIFYNWGSLWQMSDEKKAEIGNKQADTLSKLVATGLFDQDELSRAAVNLLTESGTMPGLEAYTDGDDVPDKVDALGGAQEE